MLHVKIECELCLVHSKELALNLSLTVIREVLLGRTCGVRMCKRPAAFVYDGVLPFRTDRDKRASNPAVVAPPY